MASFEELVAKANAGGWRVQHCYQSGLKHWTVVLKHNNQSLAYGQDGSATGALRQAVVRAGLLHRQKRVPLLRRNW